MQIGENIREHRKKVGLSQKELGKRLGVSQQNIAQYETGKRVPKLETIQKIANALEVELWEIVELNQMDIETRMQEIPKMISQSTQESLKQFDRMVTKSLNEMSLLENYRQLNTAGQEKAVDHVKLLTKIPEYRKKSEPVTRINAAHSDDYTNAPEELKQLEENIMDDVDF